MTSLVSQTVNSRKDLRVVIHNPSFHISDGAVLTIRKLRKELLRQGVTVKVLVCSVAEPWLKFHGYDLDDFILCPSVIMPHSGGFESTSTGADSKSKAPAEAYSIGPSLPQSIFNQISSFNPHVIHVTVADPMAYSLCKWARKSKIPLMATWHSNIPDYFDHFGTLQRLFGKTIITTCFRSVYSLPLVTYVPQEATKAMLESRNYVQPGKKNRFSVWGRGVKTEIFSPSKRNMSFREKHGVEEDQIVVLWVGRCVQEKRPELWMHVMKRLHEEFPDKVRGFVCGKMHFYKDMITIPGCVACGWKSSPEELAEAYASSDILLFPSDVETFGNVTLEALSSGIPAVVAAKCSSHLVRNKFKGLDAAEDVPSTATGFACDSKEDFYNAVKFLVLHPDICKRMGKKGRKLAEDEYSSESVLEAMVKNYMEVANIDTKDTDKIAWRFEDYLTEFFFGCVDYGGPILVKIIAMFTFDNIVFNSWLKVGLVLATGLAAAKLLF